MEFLLPLVTFSVAAAITPGPNNLMLAASGVAFGWQRTLPHLLGIPVGFTVLLLICGFGVGSLVTTVPAAAIALKTFGSGYLLYLAWAMRGAFMKVEGREAGGRPLRLYESALFQFANPKAWIMGLSAVALFMPAAPEPWIGLLAVIVAFAAVTLPCAGSWMLVGVAVEKLLIDGRRRRWFGVVMALLMVYTVVSIWLT